MSHRSSLRGNLTWTLLEHRLTGVLRNAEGFRAHCACEWDGNFKETRKGAVREHARHVTDDALMPHVDAHVDGNLAGERS